MCNLTQMLAGELGDMILNTITNILGPFLWALCDIFFIILDLFELLFRAFAGTLEGGVTVQGQKVEGDIILFLLQSNIITQIFMSVLILSLVLLIIFTILAIVKNQYAEKQEPVSKIINGSFKALLMYLLVPIATVVCLLVGNIVLQAIDGATSTQTQASASDMLFVTAAYNANKLRDSDTDDNRQQLKDWFYAGAFSDATKTEIKNRTGITVSNVDMASAEKIEIVAQIIDERFTAGTLTNNGWWNGDKWNYIGVANFYDSFRLSYITVWIGGAFLIWAIGKICWGLVARLFKITLYFAISPAVMATFPLDNGGALGSWRGEMVKNGTSAYCAVGVLNILYSILPVFNNIDIGTGIGGSIIKLFITIIAFSSAKDLIGTISGWFKTGNALADGLAAKGQVSTQLKKVGSKATGMFAGMAGGIKAAGEHGGNKFWGGMAGAFSGSGLGSNLFGKEIQEKQKAGEATYKQFRTTNMLTGKVNKDAKALYEGYDIVSDQNKPIDAQLKTMKKDRDNELAQYTPGTDEYDEVKEKWDNAMNKLKATADYLGVLFADKQRELDEQQKKNEKRSSNFTSMDSLGKGIEQDEKMMERIIQLSGATSAGARQNIVDNWEDIKQGNFNNVQGGYKKKVQSAYQMFASDIVSNDHEMERAKLSMENLVNSGKDGLKYIRKALDDQFDEMFEEVKNAAGEVESYKVKDSIDTKAVLDKIHKEQEGINEAFKKWKEDNDQLIADKAASYGTKVEKDLKEIGKNSKK